MLESIEHSALMKLDTNKLCSNCLHIYVDWVIAHYPYKVIQELCKNCLVNINLAEMRKQGWTI